MIYTRIVAVVLGQIKFAILEVGGTISIIPEPAPKDS